MHICRLLYVLAVPVVCALLSLFNLCSQNAGFKRHGIFPQAPCYLPHKRSHVPLVSVLVVGMGEVRVVSEGLQGV